jgi:hypothetical protein
VQGAVVYRSPEDPQRTQLQATLSEVQLELDDFPLTGRRFDLKGFCIAAIPELRLELSNASPERLTLTLSEVTSRSVDFGKFAED